MPNIIIFTNFENGSNLFVVLFSTRIRQHVETNRAQSHVLGNSYVIRDDTSVAIHLGNTMTCGRIEREHNPMHVYRAYYSFI